MKNLNRYSADLAKLAHNGDMLLFSLLKEYDKENFSAFSKKIKREDGKTVEQAIGKLPNFSSEYEIWYSEAKALVRQLIPDRLNDFTDHYEKPKTRKSFDAESYRISDCILGLQTTQWDASTGLDTVVIGPAAAIPRFRQQLAIVGAIEKRFESSLFDIEQTAQADLFDSELDTANTLAQRGLFRLGGMMAGVVMERHLAQVCKNHGIKLRKRKSGIADFNEALKEGSVIDTSQWRFNQHLGALRNLCAHNKEREPTKEDALDLINGVMKIIKTLY